jgi:predicted HTH domain antitoxin
MIAGELYEREKPSLGQAAEIAGLSKRTFIEIMGEYGYSYLVNLKLIYFQI